MDALPVACCAECGRQLRVVCPNGHDNADVALRDPRGPVPEAPTKDEHRAGWCNYKGGCDEPALEYSGKGRPPRRCAKHQVQHPNRKPRT